MTGQVISARVPWLAVGILSATALAYEVLLTRLFSLVHWHHLVVMIISLALLGYGVSGTFLTLLRRHLANRFEILFIGNAVLFAATLVVGFELARWLPLDPQALPWEPRQWLYLAGVYCLLAIPFFAVANCIGLALWRFRARNHQVYAVDLLGAGLGAVAVVGLLFLWAPGPVLGLLGLIASIASVIAVVELGRRHWIVPLLPVILLVGVVVAAFTDWSVPAAAYKGLSRALTVTGAQLEHEDSGPLGRFSVVGNDAVPLRYAPGLSLQGGAIPPAQRALYIDGDLAGAFTTFDGIDHPGFQQAQPMALAYRLLSRPRVLLPDPGSADALLRATAGRSRQVTAVGIHRPLFDLLTGPYAGFTGQVALRPEVELVTADPRAWLEKSVDRFDLIELGPEGGGIGGLQAQDEAYLFTLEAFSSYFSHLSENGLVSVTRWLQLPPRESLRLLATARVTLQQNGIDTPERHVAMIRSWRTFTLLLSRAPLTEERVADIRAFCRQYGFDPVWFPGISADEVNRYNRLEQAWLYDGAGQLLGPSMRQFIRDYPLRIEPVSDDRPYYYRFTRTGSLPGLLALPAGTGYSQIDWGYGFLVATLIQAAVLALLLILLPLTFVTTVPGSRGLRWRTVVYFALLGLAFMLVEIAFIQRFRLFLGHPLHAVTVVLAGFLLFAGIGSYLSRSTAMISRRPASVTAAIAIVALFYLWQLPGLFDWLMGWPTALKVAGSLLLIAPLALAMGMPFPLGLAALGRCAPDLIPWAWGINGSASVVGAVAASLLAMEIGFSGVIVVAVVLYLALPLVRLER